MTVKAVCHWLLNIVYTCRNLFPFVELNTMKGGDYMPLSCDKEILNIFVLELIEPLKEYRKAKKREPKKDAIVLNNNITQVISPIKEIEDAKYHGNSITFSSVDYWKSIVKSKIEVMRHFGGCDLGRLICAELAKHPDELEYKLSSAFEYLAQHVIEGWYM